MGCYWLLQGIFLTQGSNPHLLHLLHWQAGSLPAESQGKSISYLGLYNIFYQVIYEEKKKPQEYDHMFENLAGILSKDRLNEISHISSGLLYMQAYINVIRQMAYA